MQQPVLSRLKNENQHVRLRFLEVNHQKVLLDCGLRYSGTIQTIMNEQHVDFKPVETDAVVLSHAQLQSVV